ncbi:SCO7613 C-terminal domain-containing membrane protein [Microbacterium rhizosphaerae]|uniref:DUF2157 domain-containing protein n=1 Tax=Microbacterium rhizosphaerae TaxID=1678237 RepID=A0ABZ0SRW4_9MICO|nr:hypothetical protein [Microbacterium rhizosphaerae]WPR91026.1 hypothetical protein SM116_06960 [Microbacterium rhizosphaerae]
MSPSDSPRVGAGQHVPAAWPPSAAALVDRQRCPSCFTGITTAVCPTCGLELGMPDLAEVLKSSRRIVRLVDERTALLADIRVEQARRDARLRAAAAQARPTTAQLHATVDAETAARSRLEAERARSAAALAAAAAPTRAAAPSAAGAAIAAATPPAAVAAATPAAPDRPSAAAHPPLAHRFSMQFTILGAGVVLTSVGAIVFLFWAYLVVGLEVRSLIIAGASIGVLALAWFLRRKGLLLTAEGVGVVAVVLLMLDAWIIRANDAFGTGSVDQLAYYGGASLVLCGLLAAARALTGLRTTAYAAAALAPTGIALCSAALVPDQGSTRWWVAGVSALVLAIVAARLLPASRPHTVVLVLGALIGLSAVFAAPGALPVVPWHALITLGAAALLWGAFAVALRGGRIESRMRTTAAAVAAVAAAAAPMVAAGQQLSLWDARWIGPAGAGVVTCVVAALSTRRLWTARFATPGGSLAAQSGTLAAAIVATATSLLGVVAGVLRVMSIAAGPQSGWHGSAEPIGGGAFGGFIGGPSAVVAPVAVAVAVAAVLAATGRLRTASAAPVAALGWAAIAAATYPPAGLAAVAYAAIAAAAIAIGALAGRRSLTIVLTAIESVAAVLLLCLAYTRTELWIPATAAFLGVAVAGAAVAQRAWGGGGAPARSRALHLAIAATAACATAAAVPAWAGAAGMVLTRPWTSPWACTAIGAAAVLAVVIAARPLSSSDTWSASVPALATGLAAIAALVGAPASPIWIATLPLAVVGAIGVAVERRRAFRACLAAIAPLAAAVTVWNALPLLAIDHGYRWVGVGAGALILTGAGLLIRLPKGAPAAAAWFASNALVAMAAVAGATGSDQLWLVLLLVAPIPYLIAAATGEPTASRTNWRHVAWLTPALALAALWTALAQAGYQVVEVYTLPAAAMLLGLGVLLAFRRSPVASATGDGAPHAARTAAGRIALVWAGAATAVLPTAAASGDPALRAVLAVCAGAALLAVSPWCVARWREIPVRTVVIASGGAAAAAAAAVRGTALAMRGDWSADVWGAVSLAAGLAAAVLLDRTTPTPKPVVGAAAAGALLLGAAPSMALALLHPLLPQWVLLAPVTAAALLQVASALPRLRPLSDPLPRWTSVVALALLGAATILRADVDPFDVVTVLVGASLIASGIIGGGRGLAWAGAATAVVPSIMASADPALRPLVAVGVSAVLLAAARWVPRSLNAVPVRTIAIATAAAGAIGASGVRSLALAIDPALRQPEPWGGTPAAPEVWGLVALVGGLAAALLMQRLTSARDILPAAIAASGMAAAAVPAILIELRSDQTALLSFLPVLVFAALQVAVAVPRDRPWSHPLVTATSIGAMLAVGAAALLSGSVDPFDLVTATVGVALILRGAIRMLRTPALPSWPALGPGLAVLLVPSLLADYADPVQWRLVALGVAALGVMLVGVFLRLQAPFVLGVAVLVVHGLAQLWPVIAANYGKVWWWLWIAIAGIILIVIAATYERQLRFARSMLRTVASLR